MEKIIEHPDNNFYSMVSRLVNDFLAVEKVSPHQFRIYAIAIRTYEGRVSYWGVIDFDDVPEEDVLLEIWRRFRAAYRVYGSRIQSYGIVDLNTVAERKSFV